MKRSFLTSISVLLFLFIASGSLFLLFKRKDNTFLLPPRQNEGSTAFPSLTKEIAAVGIGIEELGSKDTRTYILDATLSEPLFQVGNLVKGQIEIKGDPTRTSFFINAGILEAPQFFGEVRGGDSSWRNVKVKDLLELVGDQKDIVVYIHFPKDLSNFSPGSSAYNFAQYQQQSHSVIRSIIEGKSSSLSQPIEVPTSQIGVRK